MSFTIPTEAAAHHIHMTEWDQGDLNVLQEAAKGNGVMVGCAVTPQGSPDMTVAVAAGSVRTNDNTTHEVSAGNATISAADVTDPRIDMVVAAQDGTVAVRAGTADPNPVQPALTAGDVALALVYVEANETAIEGTMIVDKRCFPRGHILVRKTSQESVTSSATLQDDDELFFWMGANETWIVNAHMICTADAIGPEGRWGATVPSGADLDFGIVGSEFLDTDGVLRTGYWDADIDGSPSIAPTGPATSNNTEVNIQAVIENGGTAGLFQIQWATWFSDANAWNVEAGSFLEAWKIKG